MKFAREPYSANLVGEMMPLFEKHYREIAAFKDIALAPDLAKYELLGAIGGLRIFTARMGDKLMGYEIVFVGPNLHYRASLQAQQDILFLDPSMRKGLTGYKFIAWCDDQLKAEGVEVIMQHVKMAHDFTPILERLGYQKHDIVMARRLN